MYRLLGIDVWSLFIQHSCPSGKKLPPYSSCFTDVAG